MGNFKYIALIILVFSFQTLQALSSPDLEKEIEEFDRVTKNVGPLEPNPGLMPLFEANAAKIGAAIKGSEKELAQEKFDGVCSAVRIYSNSRALSLFQYNLVFNELSRVLDLREHPVVSGFGSVNATPDLRDALEIAGRSPDQSAYGEIAHVLKRGIYITPERDFSKRDGLYEVLVDVTMHGLRPFTLVSDDGLLSYRLLNKTFALRTPVVGTPLKPTFYDGSANKSSMSFRSHDFGHMSPQSDDIFFQEVIIWNSSRYDFQYDAHAKLFNRIEASRMGNEMDLDHFLLHWVSHEEGFLYQYFPDRQVSEREMLTLQFSPVSRSHFERTVDSTKKEIVRKITGSTEKIFDSDMNSTVNLSDAEKEALLSKSTEPGKLLSLADLISKSKLLDSKFVSQTDLIKEEMTTCSAGGGSGNFMKFNNLNNSLIPYNEVLDIQAELQRLGYDFSVWKDGVYQQDAMVQLITTLFDEFKDRYSHLFPEESKYSHSN